MPVYNEELDLFRRVKEGDKKAFHPFIDKHKNMVFGYCWSILQNEFEAEQAAMETFDRFLLRAHSIKDDKKYKSYLFTIVRNLCFDVIRDRGGIKLKGKTEKGEKPRRALLIPHVPDGDDSILTLGNIPDPDGDTAVKPLAEKERQAGIRALVNEKMAKLSPNQREAIYLVHFEGLTYEEASEQLGCPIGDIRSWISRGTKKLVWSSIINKLRKLPSDLREPVRLVYYEKLSYKKASEQLGLTEDSIKPRLCSTRPAGIVMT
jgi:RNA polymerase sigma-70 factor (ECF subfamily)